MDISGSFKERESPVGTGHPAVPQLKVKGIRQRWLLNSISILVMILLVVVVAFSVVIRNYYDSSILSDMESKARIAANYFGTNASGDTSSEDYLTTAQNYVSSFEDGTRLELQFLDPSGKVIYSSNGLTLSGTMPAPGTSTGCGRSRRLPPWQGNCPRPASGSRRSLPPAVQRGAGGDHALRHLHAPGGPAGDHPSPWWR